MKPVLDRMGRQAWELKIARLREQGMSEHQAWNEVVVEWMLAGDFKPLVSMIKESGGLGLRGPALRLLAQMLATGQLRLKKGRGHPLDLEAAVRDELVADMYDEFRSLGVGHEDLVRNIGEVAGVSPESVKQAVTKRRKSKRFTGL